MVKAPKNRHANVLTSEGWNVTSVDKAGQAAATRVLVLQPARSKAASDAISLLSASFIFFQGRLSYNALAQLRWIVGTVNSFRGRVCCINYYSSSLCSVT